VSKDEAYSAECVEVEFYELRLYGVLRSSRVDIIGNMPAENYYAPLAVRLLRFIGYSLPITRLRPSSYNGELLRDTG
jgi:hypothetical protein